MSEQIQTDFTPVTEWVLDQGLGTTDVGTLIAGVCERFNDLGMRILRGHVSVSLLHPRFEARSFTWWRDEDVITTGHEVGSSEEKGWRESPLAALIESGTDAQRFRIDSGEGVDRFPVFTEFVEKGGTDYVSYIVGFGDEETAIARSDGMVCSWLTDRPGGFSRLEIAALRRLRRRLGLAVKTVVREELARSVLNAYLGPRAGAKVLDGSLHLGDGEMIEAVIWFSDLRDSSRHLGESGINGYLDLMNRYFECTAGPVMAAGGDVLRFVGDAMLAMFPLDRFGSREAAVAAAMTAWREARRLQEKENAAASKGDGIGFSVGMHAGELLYGNVGVQERLEFTVVGAAANLAARLERQASERGEPLVMSAEVAHCCGQPVRSLGLADLRGFADPVELFVPGG